MLLLKKIIITFLVALGYLYGAFGLSKSEAAELIRVALVHNQATAEISCDSDFEVQSGSNKSILPKGKYFLHIVDGKLVMDEQHAFGSTISVHALAGKALPRLNQRSYKGYLRALADNGKILVVNYVDLEQFLASVLPTKTMVVWPDEVIKAQAVAARSYALYHKQINRNKQ